MTYFLLSSAIRGHVSASVPPFVTTSLIWGGGVRKTSWCQRQLTTAPGPGRQVTSWDSGLDICPPVQEVTRWHHHSRSKARERERVSDPCEGERGGPDLFSRLDQERVLQRDVINEDETHTRAHTDTHTHSGACTRTAPADSHSSSYLCEDSHWHNALPNSNLQPNPNPNLKIWTLSQLPEALRIRQKTSFCKIKILICQYLKGLFCKTILS